MANKDNYLVTMTVTYKGETRDTGTWDKMSGGDADSEVSKYREGGMGPETAHGGNQTTSDITLSRRRKRPGEGRDDLELIKWLYEARGKGRAVVKKNYLDSDGNVVGRPDVFQGVFQRLSGSDVDS